MADDAEDGAEDERLTELFAIQAIYPELSLDESDPYSARIDIPVELLQPLLVRFSNPVDGGPVPALTESLSTVSVNTDGPAANKPQGVAMEPTTFVPVIHHLSHLPPVTLILTLPKGYPSEHPPELSVQSSWLSSALTDQLEKSGQGIWEDGGHEQMVFAYLDSVREQAETAFGLVLGDRAALELSAELQVSLLDYDLKAKKRKFEQETFECGICLEPKKGSVCHRLTSCLHVFCVECLQDFFNSCITEGDVGKVKCTAPKCGDDDPTPSSYPNGVVRAKPRRKRDRTLEPSELLQIPLSQDAVQRYITLKRKKRLESDRRTIYCPRQWCQGPARSQKSKWKSQLDEDSDGEGEAEPLKYDPSEPDKLPPPAERLAICEDCAFAFCKVCKASWHGEFFSCFPRSQVEISAEERASEDYMKFYTQACPTCDARAQKTHGCNHMICGKCDTHFCYLCGAYLERDNPYMHFNTRGRDCFMRLWELEAGDGMGVINPYNGPQVPFDDTDEENEENEEPEPVNVAELANRQDGNGQPHLAELHRHMQDLANARQRLEELQVRPLPALAQLVPLERVPRPAGEPAAAPRQRGGGGGAVDGRNGGDAGLQRFLRLAHEDQEDEWDSDEMEDDADELGDRWVG